MIALFTDFGLAGPCAGQVNAVEPARVKRERRSGLTAQPFVTLQNVIEIGRDREGFALGGEVLGITGIAITVTVYSILSVPGSSFDILNPDAAPLPQTLSRVLDAAQKARVDFEPVIEPVVLGPEADQQSGRFPVSGDYDLLVFGFACKPREIVLNFG